MAIAGVKADLYITSTPAVAVLDEPATEVTVAQGAPAALRWWRVTNNARRFADPAIAVTVDRSVDAGVTWTVVPAAEYTFDPVGAIAKFNAAQAAGTLIRYDYSYLPIAKLGGAKEWSLDLDVDLIDATTFGDTWKRRVAGVKDATGSITKWWLDNAFLSLLGSRLGVVLYTDFAANTRYEAFAWLKGESIGAAVDGLVEDELTFECEGNVNYATW